MELAWYVGVESNRDAARDTLRVIEDFATLERGDTAADDELERKSDPAVALVHERWRGSEDPDSNRDSGRVLITEHPTDLIADRKYKPRFRNTSE